MNRQSERGNVLWFILVAIVLMGLITAILSRSGTSVDQSGDTEQVRIKIGQMLRYTKSIESAIQQMKLRGIPENDISFENAVTATDYTNANCTMDDCKIFSVGGGGLTYQNPFAGTNDGSDWIFTGANNVGTTDGPIGTTAARSGNDIIMLLPNATPEFCIQVNREVKLGTGGTLPVDTSGISTDEYVGIFDSSNPPTILDGDPSPFELDKKTSGCFTDNAAGITYFYQVLLAR